MSKLYNLAKKITAHTKAKGTPATGYTLAGCAKGDGSNWEYVNIYIPADRVLAKKKLPPDGNGNSTGYAITFMFTDVTIKEKAKPEEAAKLRQIYEEGPF